MASVVRTLLRPAKLLAPLNGSDRITPAIGDFYFWASSRSVTLPTSRYNYRSDWTPLLAGLAPAGTAASFAAPTLATKRTLLLTWAGLSPAGPAASVAAPRTRLRMMLTSPRSPLSFRTAGFPRYGWKAGFQMGPSRLSRELKSAPDMRGALASLHPSFVHLVVQRLSRTGSGR